MPESSYFTAAHHIARRLRRDAIRHGDRCTWMTWSMEPVGGSWDQVFKSCGPDLYAGNAGIAWFLAQIYRHTREPWLRDLSAAAMRQAWTLVDELSENLPYGAYSGALGLMWAASELADALDAPEWLEQAGHALGHLTKKEGELQPGERDVMAGAAGAIPMLVQLADVLDKPYGLELAAAQAEALLAAAEPAAQGLCWDTMGDGQTRPLTGYSHGAAGIATAFSEWYVVSDDVRFRRAALAAIAYENSCFADTAGNWPDFRPGTGASESAPACMQAWCHGAPGIALGRLRCLELGLDTDVIRRDIERSLRSVQEHMHVLPGSSFSLCHGLAGNACALLEAAQITQQSAFKQHAQQIADAGMAMYERECLWPSGVSGGGSSPSLMLGLAGVGAFLLLLDGCLEGNPTLLHPQRVGMRFRPTQAPESLNATEPTPELAI